MASSYGRRYVASKIQDGVNQPELVNISETMKHIIIIPTATTVFGVSLYSGGTFGFVGRRRVLEIQDSSQITGSSNNFVCFTDTHVVPKTIQGFMSNEYVRNIYMASSHGRH